MLDGIEIPDMTLYLVAVLALLVIWQYYQMQIMAGRILAVDIFDRSGIRMYCFVTADDDHICEVCSAAAGRICRWRLSRKARTIRWKPASR